MAPSEQRHLKSILPAETMSDGLSPEDKEFLLAALTDGDLDANALGADLSTTTTTFTNPSRKRTYELRKDEIDALEKKAALLAAKLEVLKHRAGIQDEQSIAQQQLNNHMLREILRNQQFLIAGFRSLVAVDTSDTILSPVSTRIHLGSNPAERRNLLRDIQFQKIHDARRFLESRTQHSPTATRFSESMRRRTDEGETIAVRLDIVPLPEAKSVKQVFDAIVFYFAHLEIYMTEMLGNVTVREETLEREVNEVNKENEKQEEGVAQHRFLYTNQHSIQIETNSVQFSEYAEDYLCPFTGDLRGDAIVTTDFVDQDDLFPYSPHERMRKDITSVFHVRACARPLRADEGDMLNNGGGGGDMPVVLAMWCQTTLRRCEFEIPEAQVQELNEDSNRVHEAILKCVRASLRSNQL